MDHKPLHQSRMIVVAAAVAVTSFACGLVIGLPVLGWWLWPVQWTDIPVTPLPTYTPFPTYTALPTHTPHTSSISPSASPTHKEAELPTSTATPDDSTPTSLPTNTLAPPPTATAIEIIGCPSGCTFHKTDCDIKGNVAFDNGEKIYHVLGGEFYDQTVINPDFGERWFCTEAEAISNGWRRSQR